MNECDTSNSYIIFFFFTLQNFSIHYWIEKGAPAKKLVMGAPLYGQSFSLAERTQRGLNAPTYGGGEAGEATKARGFLSYYEVSIFHFLFSNFPSYIFYKHLLSLDNYRFAKEP